MCDPSKCDFNTILQETGSPVIPDDHDTITDSLGIKWYKQLIDCVIAKAKVSKPLAIDPDLADFVRIINGERVCYYSSSNAKKILNKIVTSDSTVYNSGIGDPIYIMYALGLLQIDPVDYRTVWNPIEGGDWFVRGDVIATYPELGYYMDGEWMSDDVFWAIDEDDDTLHAAKIKSIFDDEFEELDMSKAAIPLKILINLHPHAQGPLSNLAAPMSLRKIVKAND